MIGLLSLNTKEKKTVRQSRKILHIETANGIAVSDTQAKVYIKELGASIWVQVVEDSPSVYRWEDFAMNLVILVRGRQEKLPDYQNAKKWWNAASKTSLW